jgi:hypothetical protein
MAPRGADTHRQAQAGQIWTQLLPPSTAASKSRIVFFQRSRAAATHRKAPILLLATRAPRSYVQEFTAFTVMRGVGMHEFEKFGRRIVQEVRA